MAKGEVVVDGGAARCGEEAEGVRKRGRRKEGEKKRIRRTYSRCEGGKMTVRDGSNGNDRSGRGVTKLTIHSTVDFLGAMENILDHSWKKEGPGLKVLQVNSLTGKFRSLWTENNSYCEMIFDAVGIHRQKQSKIKLRKSTNRICTY
ncbi:hypothetical protein M9H77_35760 [Catharanthus roseus]|uniref:Uncharacterized protein n=1 Tax=Catharanthus roseus TaxID=4058 RepID=A0ACB9ZQQ1_CATRO|nr:hypothetical protein M9H77_35760 [Catharanthus roseus]